VDKSPFPLLKFGSYAVIKGVSSSYLTFFYKSCAAESPVDIFVLIIINYKKFCTLNISNYPKRGCIKTVAQSRKSKVAECKIKKFEKA